MSSRKVSYFANLPKRVWGWSLPTKIMVLASLIGIVVGVRNLFPNGSSSSVLSTAAMESAPFDGRAPGLLICKFGGNNLDHIFGVEGIGHHLALRILDQLDSLNLRGELQIKVIDHVVRDDNEAKALSEKYRAQFVMWGSVLSLETRAEIEFLLDAGIFVFAVGFDSTSASRIAINLRTGRRFDLDLRDSLFNLDAFARSLATTLMPSIAISLANNKPELSLKILESLPRWDQWYLRSKMNGYLVLSLGNLWERVGNSGKAVYYYDLAYSMFESMYRCAKSKRCDSPISDTAAVRRIAASSKWMEATAALGLRDTAHAIECMNLAACTDRSLGFKAAKNIAIMDPKLDRKAIQIVCGDTNNIFMDWIAPQ